MNLLFSGFNALFGFVFYPFENINPAWGMICISLVAGIIMLVIFRYTSNQQGIKKAKAKVSAYILEMRLFSHDLGKMLASLGKTFLANLFYLRYMIFPLILIIVPVMVVLIQLSYRYENRPLQTGEPVIVKAVLKAAFPVLETPVHLEVSKDVTIETAKLRVSTLNEVDWRISAKKEGIYRLEFMADGRRYEKQFHVNSTLAALSVSRISSSLQASLLNHAEPPLPDDSPFESLQILYPERTMIFAGLTLHWIVYFFILSVVAGFAFKNVFRVEL